MGSFGSYVYFGFVVGSIVNGTCLVNRFSWKMILSAAFVLNGVGASFFFITSDYYILSLARFMSGFGQILVSIYNPLFVDTFFDEKGKSFWLPICIICGPLGTCIGYSVTGILTSTGFNWTTSFFFLSMCNAGCFVLFNMISSGYINLNEVHEKIKEKKREERGEPNSPFQLSSSNSDDEDCPKLTNAESFI